MYLRLNAIRKQMRVIAQEHGWQYRGKVFTKFTLLIINNLSVYTIPYIFSKVFTSL